MLMAMNLCISQKHPQRPNASTIYRTFLKQQVKNLQLSMVKLRANSEDSPDGTRSLARMQGNGWPGKFSISTVTRRISDSETEAAHCISPYMKCNFVKIRIA